MDTITIRKGEERIEISMHDVVSASGDNKTTSVLLKSGRRVRINTGVNVFHSMYLNALSV